MYLMRIIRNRPPHTIRHFVTNTLQVEQMAKFKKYLTYFLAIGKLQEREVSIELTCRAQDARVGPIKMQESKWLQKVQKNANKITLSESRQVAFPSNSVDLHSSP